MISFILYFMVTLLNSLTYFLPVTPNAVVVVVMFKVVLMFTDPYTFSLSSSRSI